jgi:acyl-CoA synthetase
MMAVLANVDPGRVAEFRRAGYWGDAGLYDYWRLAVLAGPEREAVVDSRGHRSSYGQVNEVASRLAGYLREAGVRRGDVVSVQLPNWAEFLVVDVACMKLGAIINPMLPQHRLSEARYFVETCSSTAVVMATQFRSTDYRELAGRINSECPTVRALLTVENGGVADDRFTTIEEATRHDPLPEDECSPGRGTDVAAVLFTSGSEARPKGVMLTHDNVLAGERAFVRDLGIGFTDRMFMPAPLGHATGYLHGVTMPFMVGGTSVLLDVFCGSAAVAMVNAERATCGMGATTIIRDMLDAAEVCEPFHDGLRFLNCGGAPVPRDMVERAMSLGFSLHSVYGSTESAPHTLTRPGDPIDRVIGTDGRAVTGTQVKIVDPRTRVELPFGSEGEEASRGPGVFAGYLGDPELSDKVVDADGWYYSGDLAICDEDGYLRITGRLKDVIVRGGQNISATEVEAILGRHPGVKDAAVVAMPHPRFGEIACAYVVQRPGSALFDLAEVRRFFAEQEVAMCKTPERVEIVDSLPMTPAGKVRKVELRERIAAQIELEGPVDIPPVRCCVPADQCCKAAEEKPPNEGPALLQGSGSR